MRGVTTFAHGLLELVAALTEETSFRLGECRCSVVEVATQLSPPPGPGAPEVDVVSAEGETPGLGLGLTLARVLLQPRHQEICGSQGLDEASRHSRDGGELFDWIMAAHGILHEPCVYPDRMVLRAWGRGHRTLG